MNEETNVFDLGDAESRPAWKVDLENALRRFLGKPVSSEVAEQMVQAIAGPLRSGIREGDVVSRVWDICQTPADEESGQYRVLARGTVVELNKVVPVRIWASLVLEGATEEERCALS